MTSIFTFEEIFEAELPGERNQVRHFRKPLVYLEGVNCAFHPDRKRHQMLSREVGYYLDARAKLWIASRFIDR